MSEENNIRLPSNTSRKKDGTIYFWSNKDKTNEGVWINDIVDFFEINKENLNGIDPDKIKKCIETCKKLKKPTDTTAKFLLICSQNSGIVESSNKTIYTNQITVEKSIDLLLKTSIEFQKKKSSEPKKETKTENPKPGPFSNFISKNENKTEVQKTTTPSKKTYSQTSFDEFEETLTQSTNTILGKFNEIKNFCENEFKKLNEKIEGLNKNIIEIEKVNNVMLDKMSLFIKKIETLQPIQPQPKINLEPKEPKIEEIKEKPKETIKEILKEKIETKKEKEGPKEIKKEETKETKENKEIKKEVKK